MTKIYRIIYILPIVVMVSLLTCCGRMDMPPHSSMTNRELYKKGISFLKHNEVPDSALLYLSALANRLSPEMNDEEVQLCGRALNHLGYLYFHYYGNIPYAFESLTLAKKIALETNDRRLYGQTCLNLAIANIICQNLKLTDEGRDVFISNLSEGFDNAVKAGDGITILNCFANMSTELGPDFMPRQFVERIEKLRRMKPGPQDSINGTEFFNERLLTSQAIIEGDYPKAMQLLHRQLGTLDDVFDSQRVKSQLYQELARLHRGAGNSDSATIYLDKALRVARKDSNLYDQAVIYKSMHDLADKNGQRELAGRYLTDYYMMRDSAIVKNNLMSPANLEKVGNIKYQNKGFTYQIAKQRRQLMVAAFLVILLVITIPLVVLLYNKNRKLRESHRVLYERYKEAHKAKEATADNKAKQAEKCRAKGTVSEGSPAIADGVTGSRETGEKQNRKEMADAESSELLRLRVEKIMEESDEVFSPDFSLDRLAELADSKPRIISYVINETLGKTFYNLLNERRVREACQRLEDSANYGHLTIEAISRSVGYSSRTTLVTAFKKITGLTPSEYQRASH